jgi:hypothetical protein
MMRTKTVSIERQRNRTVKNTAARMTNGDTVDDNNMNFPYSN